MKEIDSILRTDFCSFIEKSFYSLNPGTKYLHNWHIELIAESLERIAQGKCKRLIINMPTRYLKSICVSVAWPAWLLGNDPSRRIITASHSSSLSIKHSVDCRKIIQSKWYKKIFPNFRFAPDQNEKSKFMSSHQGFRMAASVQAPIIGEGGNFLIVDDPLSPEKAYCKASRRQLVEWFDSSFSTRLDDKKLGAIVVVMQRLHDEDLCGVLQKRGGWEVLSFPAIGEKGLLHEEREGIVELSKIRSDLGEYAFAAQYLQKPLREEGNLIKKEWLQFYGDTELPDDALIYQSWDTAIKTGENSDYSVGITFAETKCGFYLIDIERQKLAYPDLKRRITQLAEKYKPHAILIEDKASGQSVIQDLREETTLPIIPQLPKHDKLTRLAAISPMIESGKLHLPRGRRNVEYFLDELIGFPAANHDDMVDALSQFLTWVKNKNNNIANIRRI